MSNAKRRHRRRHRKHEPTIALLRVHAELVAKGYAYDGCNGWFHHWTKIGPAPDWAGLEPQDCLYVETVECP